jgi:1-deoxy-D-xylulose-5-phosphate synthase
MNDHNYQPKVVRMGLPDSFVEHGTVAELQKITGLSEEDIVNAIKEQ